MILAPSADIIMADDGVPFDGHSLSRGPLGGAETAFIGLAEALAARGHRVRAYTRCTERLRLNGVEWFPFDDGIPEAADLYIANRGHKVLDLVPKARRIVFWMHNPCGYVLKPRYLLRFLRRRPVMVFLGPFHAGTLPRWVPSGGRVTIPYGLSTVFRDLRERSVAPRPRAIFTSNPLRRLDWLLDIWADRIQPMVEGAELHIFSSLMTYGGGSPEKRALAQPILVKARTLDSKGVVLHNPISKMELAAELMWSRVFLYGGDPGETFCLAAAESQAAGVPGVVARSTCLGERVHDGRSGFVVDDDDKAAFAARAVQLLTDDALWLRQHQTCLAEQRGLSWDDAAQQWEALLP